MKKYAFVSDVARLYAINKYGGIYLDTDIEVLKDFSAFLNCSAIFSWNQRPFDDGIFCSRTSEINNS